MTPTSVEQTDVGVVVGGGSWLAWDLGDGDRLPCQQPSLF